MDCDAHVLCEYCDEDATVLVLCPERRVPMCGRCAGYDCGPAAREYLATQTDGAPECAL